MGVSLARSSQWSGVSAVHDIAEDDSDSGQILWKGFSTTATDQHSARRIHAFFVNIAISAVPTTAVPTEVVYSCG